MRIVQVGLGNFGRSWTRLLREAPGVELVAAVDAAPAARERAANEAGLAPEIVFASLADAIAATSPEAALIVTPPVTHAPLAREALAAGLHVMVEKPLATTMEDAQAVVEAAAAADRIVMASQNYRHRAPARTVQAAVRERLIGDLINVRITFHRDSRQQFPENDFRYSMLRPLILDMSIHHADLLRMVTGQNVVDVVARGWRAPDSPYLHDPSVAALLTLESGATVLYQGDWATRDPDTSWNGDWELLGTDGILRWTGGVEEAGQGAVNLLRWDAPARELPLIPVACEDRAGTLQAFRTAIETGIEPETSGRDNLGSLGIVLAMAESVTRQPGGGATNGLRRHGGVNG